MGARSGKWLVSGAGLRQTEWRWLGETKLQAKAQCHILFPGTAHSALIVGRTPWSAADAPVGLLGMDRADFVGEERVQGDPCGPGGPRHRSRRIPYMGK